MLAWLVRGIRGGRITTRYPRVPEPPRPGFHATVEVIRAGGGDASLQGLCPTGAIEVDAQGGIRLDGGRCILCGECVRRAGEHFAFSDRRFETAARSRTALHSDRPTQPEARAPALGDRARGLRRSIHVRHIDCGSDGSEEWEIQALWNPYYDIQRLGFFLTPAPRHADILLVTGGVTAAMRRPLERTWEVMPEPKALVAVGTDACSGGLAAAGGHVAGGVDRVLPVDVYVPGSPPPPIAIMHGLLTAVGLLTEVEDQAA
jgi:Ni,Fe-hydrogenase III small subunit/ferredoxin